MRRKTPAALIYVTVFLLLILTGAAYRTLGNRMKLIGRGPIILSVPLSHFPKKFGNWIGSDLDIQATTKEYMERNFADDFFSRRYVNSADQIWADIYVVYCSTRPSGILGHRPGVCYPAHGWIQQSNETSQFTSRSGRVINCLIQRFRKPAPLLEEVVVLNFYVRNGQITTQESDFSGLFSRKPNIARDQSRYVAQVQISSVLESSVRKAAQEAVEIILDFLPDENGKVKVAESVRLDDEAENIE